jgi:predicted nucleic acid-binding protein
MKDRFFIDTNLWIYLYDLRDEFKRKSIEKIINDNFENILISTQVLNEIYNTLSKKIKIDHHTIKEIIFETIINFEVSNLSVVTVLQAIELKAKYQFSYWDSLIVSSALENNCTLLYSEDLQNNQIIENKLRIINPFL